MQEIYGQLMALKPIYRQNSLFKTANLKTRVGHGIPTGPTSSMGSSSSSGRHGASTPMRKGVGEQLMSSMLAGSTGTKVCCQVKGYSSASTAWLHRDNTLRREDSRALLSSHTDHVPQIEKRSLKILL